MTESASASEEARHSRAAAGIARGAGVIAGLTMAARILGLVRTLAFSQTVGATCLGTAYFTANQVPNLVYELVLGGALGSAMVPVLARSAERARTDPAERAQVSQILSALLTWTVVLLVPLTLIVIGGAGPIASLLNPANPSAHCSHAALVATTATMLRIFAPQAVLYGLTVVLFGLLQAYRRFAGYALAPLISSLVLIASYIAFAPLGRGLPLSSLPMSAQLVLAGGATAGVAVMVVVGLVPTWRLHLRLRPTLSLPPGVARRAGGLVTVGLIEVIVQQISGVAVITLANGRGDTGALVLFNYASQVFNSLNAVLALSIVLSTFPVLSARDGDVFDRTCAGSTRAVVLVACLGMAVTGAVTVPAAHVLAGQSDQVSQLVLGFALFAPGLVGAGIIANLTRALLAIGRLKSSAVLVGGSSLLGAVAQVVLALLVPAHLVVGALSLGSTVGFTGMAIPAVILTRRIRSRAAVQGVGRVTLAGLAAAAAGVAVGVAVSVALPEGHKLLDVLVGAVASIAAIIAFAAVAFAFDDGDLQALVARLRQRGGPLRLPGAVSFWNRGHGVLLRLQLTRQVLKMNLDNDEWASARDDGSRASSLTLRERQAAVAIGLVAGGTGGYAVFASGNQAGTVLLLVISLVFLLIGVEGTPLLRTGRRMATADGRHRVAEALRQASEESQPEDPYAVTFTQVGEQFRQSERG
jgi:putative peptidoglycan lipid II flippase